MARQRRLSCVVCDSDEDGTHNERETKNAEKKRAYIITPWLFFFVVCIGCCARVVAVFVICCCVATGGFDPYRPPETLNGENWCLYIHIVIGDPDKVEEWVCAVWRHLYHGSSLVLSVCFEYARGWAFPLFIEMCGMCFSFRVIDASWMPSG